jgi:hypothetical protein
VRNFVAGHKREWFSGVRSVSPKSGPLLPFWRCFGLRVDFPSAAAAAVLQGTAGSIFGPGVAAISLGLVGHHALAERLGRNQRFASIGSLSAAAIMGGIGYLLSTREDPTALGARPDTRWRHSLRPVLRCSRPPCDKSSASQPGRSLQRPSPSHIYDLPVSVPTCQCLFAAADRASVDTCGRPFFFTRRVSVDCVATDHRCLIGAVGRTDRQHVGTSPTPIDRTCGRPDSVRAFCVDHRPGPAHRHSAVGWAERSHAGGADDVDHCRSDNRDRQVKPGAGVRRGRLGGWSFAEHIDIRHCRSKVRLHGGLVGYHRRGTRGVAIVLAFMPETRPSTFRQKPGVRDVAWTHPTGAAAD